MWWGLPFLFVVAAVAWGEVPIRQPTGRDGGLVEINSIVPCTTASSCGNHPWVLCTAGVCGCAAECLIYNASRVCALRKCRGYSEGECTYPAAKSQVGGVILAVFFGM